MKPCHRTTLGILLFIPLAAILLATFACLPTPVGNPENSKVDPSLSGVYQLSSDDPADKDTTTLAIIRPWDSHTYQIDFLKAATPPKNPPAADDAGAMHFKAWLTDVDNATLITCQPMDNVKALVGEKPDGPFYVVLRLDRTPDGLTAWNVNSESTFFKNLPSDIATQDPKAQQNAIEAIVKAHVHDPALYDGKPLKFKKLDKSSLKLIATVLSSLGVKADAAETPAPPITIETQPAPKPNSMP